MRMPVLGKDKLLTTEEAVKAIHERPFEPKMDAALTNLAKEGRIRVWLMDGELAFQYDRAGDEQRASTASKP